MNCETPAQELERCIPMSAVAEQRAASEKEPVILPFNIGIAPAVEPFRATEPAPAEPVVVQAGCGGGKTFDGPPVILGSDGEPADKLTWPKYLAWRKTKCRPYDYLEGPKLARTIGDALWLSKVEAKLQRDRALEEIDQAIHEFVGEVAELGELIIKSGPNIFYEDRTKLIDEIGDILFCGAWVLDAWGKNPLDEDSPWIELVDIDAMPSIAGPASVIEANTLEQLTRDGGRFLNGLSAMVQGMFVTASTASGLLCNSYKKLRFQRREQNVDTQVERVVTVFITVNQLLGLASATVEDAMRSNMRKLDARFPEGYKPGVGGGIREGAGR